MCSYFILGTDSIIYLKDSHGRRFIFMLSITEAERSRGQGVGHQVEVAQGQPEL